MACSPDFVQYIIDLCSGADAITPNIVCSQGQGRRNLASQSPVKDKPEI